MNVMTNNARDGLRYPGLGEPPQMNYFVPGSRYHEWCSILVLRSVHHDPAGLLNILCLLLNSRKHSCEAVNVSSLPLSQSPHD